MMTEVSLNVLDVSENSTQADVSLVSTSVTASMVHDKLTIVIVDDGRGMAAEQVAHVTDPFFTTRTARKVGLGIPLFKYAAESTGGSFHIESEPGKGTTMTAVFGLSHTDRMPLGDMSATMHNLIVYHPDTNFICTYAHNDASFALDIQEMRKIPDGVPLNSPEISAYITEFLRENQQETDGGAQL